MDKIKKVLNNLLNRFKNLDKTKKYVIGIGTVSIILAVIFSFNYSSKNKYGILFSGLDSIDAVNICNELESRSVDTKIEGDTIYVPKEQVDKLRLELSSTITNGSKGYELMDEGSSITMTDEEFQIKKLRMLQGEIEKTIKTFPQVESARVHITQGKESVFTKENTEGKAAVYVSLKVGRELDESQIKSIISLVSASTTNIPKQNIEVIDQNMNLLSEGIYDEDGNLANNGGLASTRAAEREVSEDLQKSIISMLEAIFGKDKVKATVNANLNFDTVEKNEIKVDPDKVILSEYRNENSYSSGEQTGSPVDNNMSNTEEADSSDTSSIEEQIEYEVGKTEIKTISNFGGIKRVTASVAIDGDLTEAEIANVEKIVSAAIGIDNNRGDQLSVISMRFNNSSENVFDDGLSSDTANNQNMIYIAYVAGAAAIVILAIIIGVLIYKRRTREDDEEIDAVFSEIINNEMDNVMNESKSSSEETIEMSIEEEVRMIVSQNPEQITKLIKTWLNE